MKNALVILQNAWSPLYAGDTWPRESWLPALHWSRSGQRLAVMAKECPDVALWYDNTTPIVGESPSSVVPADRYHMKEVFGRVKPDCVVALGKQSGEACLSLWKGEVPVVTAPHPAYRVVTNLLYACVGRLLATDFSDDHEISQDRGSVRIVSRTPRHYDEAIIFEEGGFEDWIRRLSPQEQA